MALLNLGIIGLGMFGGKVAKLGAEINAPGIIINASKKDIEKLGDLNGVASFVVGDGKGTGKDRDTSKEFLLNHIGVVQEPALVEICKSCDIIIVAGSAGGGFGSGSMPALTNVLMEMFTSKLFIPLTVMPDEDETYTAQKHAEETIKEIMKLETPYLIYDNNKYKNLSSVACLKKVNDCIKRDLQIIRGDFVMDTVDSDDTSSNMDERDILRTLSSPGRIVCGMLNPIKLADVEKAGSIMALMKESIDASAHAELTDDKVIKASATMVSLSGELLDTYSSAIKGDLQETYGGHITDYRNEVVNDETGNDFVATILAGLTDPVERLDKIIAKRKKQEKEIVTRKATVSKFANDQESSGLKLGVKSFGSDADTTSENDIPDVSNILKNLKI